MKLKIGTVVIIEKNFVDKSERYKSKIIDNGDGFVMIDYPTHIETGKTAFFLDGTQLFVSFTDELKVSYFFKTEVSGRHMKGIPMLKLSYPGDDKLVNIQRREFVRTETSLDVAVLKRGENAQFVAEDISAGGLALNLDDCTPYTKKDFLSLLIVLPFMNGEQKYVRAKGEIVRITERNNRKIASVKFHDISAENRQRILRFCFETELKMRNG